MNVWIYIRNNGIRLVKRQVYTNEYKTAFYISCKWGIGNHFFSSCALFLVKLRLSIILTLIKMRPAADFKLSPSGLILSRKYSLERQQISSVWKMKWMCHMGHGCETENAQQSLLSFWCHLFFCFLCGVCFKDFSKHAINSKKCKLFSFLCMLYSRLSYSTIVDLWRNIYLFISIRYFHITSDVFCLRQQITIV